MTHIVGFIAAILTTIAFVPQVVKVIQTRSTRDISLFTFILSSAGVFFWLVYGLMINDGPLIMANAVTFILYFVILTYKLRFK